jgi:AraC-like DNA-binding protein
LCLRGHDLSARYVAGCGSGSPRDSGALANRAIADPCFSLADIASLSRLSTWHSARLLKAATGATLTALVHRARVTAAQRLLQDTTLSIKEIAVQVGYDSSSRFGKHFKRLCVPSKTGRAA